jgi:hypothetical protein
LVSVANIHFSQGDGEISFCRGIEMAGRLDLKISILPDLLTFEGIRVDESGNIIDLLVLRIAHELNDFRVPVGVKDCEARLGFAFFALATDFGN